MYMLTGIHKLRGQLLVLDQLEQKLVFYKQLHFSLALARTNTRPPRVEAQLDYSFELGGLGGYVWVDGQYQNLGRTTAEAQLSVQELQMVMQQLLLKQLVNSQKVLK